MAAHAADDRFSLSGLYLEAGELKLADDNIDAACFLFTQAYVYGLDAGNEAAGSAARRALVKHGRDR